MKSVRISFNVPRETWLGLRRIAEAHKGPRDRASVAAVVRGLIQRALERNCLWDRR